MKYMLLIHQGTTPLPGTDGVGRPVRGRAEGAVYADYQAINQTPGVTPGGRCSRPRRRPPCACRTAGR